MGSLLVGPVPQSIQTLSSTSSVNISVDLNRFWDLDSIVITGTTSESDNDAIYRHFEKTLIKDTLDDMSSFGPRKIRISSSPITTPCVARLKSLLNRQKPCQGCCVVHLATDYLLDKND